MARAVKEKPQRTRNKFYREHREKLWKEAQIRQAAYDALTPDQKLAKLNAGGYVAAKQRAKLVTAGQKVVAALTETLAAEPKPEKKERKGTKARRQGRKDKKAND